MELIDTHCHLYSEEFVADLPAVIERAGDAGVGRIYLPAIDSQAMGALLALEEQHHGLCFAMMGLHPCYVKENFREELAKVKEQLSHRRFAAVGEIGLDYYWDKTHGPQQQEAFRDQLQWSVDFDLPVVIHTREAMRDTIDVVKDFKETAVRGIFHCFGGSLAEAVEITAMGFYLGIGGVVTYKSAGLAEVIRELPLEHLVLETDAPYLSPVPFRGKRNGPAYIRQVAEKIAEIKNIPLEEVADVTTANAQKIFAL